MNFFSELGPYSTPFYILSAIILLTAVFKGRIIWNNENKDISIRLIWVMGLIVFLSSLGGYVYEIWLAFEMIEAAGDIQPSLVASGIKGALIVPLAGIFILVFSVGLWATLHELKRFNQKTSDTEKDNVL
ncbi:hypothetical protein [Mangrovivirga cuniculi]|uniref:MotA/TolQ/ExbB proton channel domain-containing protein n=1 Tax=Mangrovivirga cuniculi TaxID=2715131 RepID=A0A4D7JSY8_9BACT|nr:hypothetical protein [Mangrovivirga cuniculi]QCK16610.1 hypothetical protein DCC35_18680 [Mangrovivirga cuniculi]